MVDVLWERSIFEELRNFSYDSGSNRSPVYPEKNCREAVGPGALSGWIRKRASLISFAVGITVNASLSSAEMDFLRASSTMLDGSELFIENRLEKYFVITSIIYGSS